jgi:hypothetical protein
MSVTSLADAGKAGIGSGQLPCGSTSMLDNARMYDLTSVRFERLLLAVACSTLAMTASAAAGPVPHGGAGTVSVRGTVGPLQIDRSTPLR